MSPSVRRFVAYYRVSTARQGRSGLGLEAQRAAVLAFINGNAELVAEFTEVESGKHAHREELKKAIAACKKQRPSSSLLNWTAFPAIWPSSLR
jgi:DNA invertase Pin-like site-specific DNA recombinase